MKVTEGNRRGRAARRPIAIPMASKEKPSSRNAGMYTKREADVPRQLPVRACPSNI